MLFRSSHLPSYCSIATRTIPISRCFSLPNLPKRHRLGVLTLPVRTAGVQRRSQCWKKSLACANRPRPRHVSVRSLFSPLTRPQKSYSLSVALPPKLRILPPKRKNTTTQAPEPRQGSSFSKGPWETLWDCDLEAESPIEEDFHLGSFPDYHAEQGSEPDEDVATPVNGTSWTSDEELTPLFSSNFPTRSTDPNASMREGYSASSGSRCLNSHRA